MIAYHIQRSRVIMMNLHFWKRLAPARQKAAATAMKQAGEYETDLALNAEAADPAGLWAIDETIVPSLLG